jgi:hypothetical protein
VLIDLKDDPEFGQPSWEKWREILSRVTERTRELWIVAGRGGGKTRVASRIVLEHALREWPHAPGERIFCALIAPSREQAQIALGYIKAAVPPELIDRETRDALDLANGNTILVVTASTAAPRGRSYAVVVVDEVAFLPTEDSSEPDTAILQAVRPGLARVRGSMLVCISSPWAQRGELWRAAQRWGQTGGDEQHVFAQASTTELNPIFDETEVRRAYQQDPTAAATEYGGLWRSDAETFLSRELIDAATEHRPELPYRDGCSYRAFVDPSGGSQDSYTLAVAHAEGAAVVIDALVEIRPPFDPDVATARLAQVVKAYGLHRVVGDRFGGEWPRSRWRAHDIHYAPAEKSATQYYQAALPLFSSGRIRMPNNPRAVTQLASLERTVSRAGRETISHPPGGHDDLANAIAGAAIEAGDRGAASSLVVNVTWGPVEREMPDGLDFRGREWRCGRPWSGVFPEFTPFSMKGLPLDFPPKFEAGRKVPLTEAEQQYYRDRPPKPPRRQSLVWG